ncbi:MAG: hypothetical protein JWO78_1328 [Micavibrio sp.]|nr:hypothetical protein [Micavibrio sp.]
MTRIHDFQAALQARRKKLSAQAENPLLDYTATTRDQALMTRLHQAFADAQLYAVVDDFGPDPQSGDTVRGFHILKFAADVKSEAIPYEMPVAHHFLTRADFAGRFSGTGHMLPHPVDHMVRHHQAALRDPFAPVEVYRRNIEKVEIVSRGGLYSRTDINLRFAVQTDDYVVTPVGGFPDVLSQKEAFLRLRRITPGSLALRPLYG